MNYSFSVSMCVYKGDSAQWFKDSVDSVLSQTLLPSEIVLVVDGPVSESLNQVIRDLQQNPLFKIIRLEKNMGHGFARQIGLENCSYDYVALMDADDICRLDRFEREMQIMKQNNQIDVVGGFISEFIDNPNNSVGIRTVPEYDIEIKKYAKHRCPMNQVSVLFKKKSVLSVGGYLSWFCEEDYYLWIRMILGQMAFYNIQDVLVDVRVGLEMYNRRGGKEYYHSERKFQKYLLENRVISKWTFINNVVERFIVQMILPSSLRGLLFQKYARKKLK